MRGQSQHLQVQFGVKVGDTVLPASDQAQARFLLTRLKASQPVLVTRRVKTTEGFWEEVS